MARKAGEAGGDAAQSEGVLHTEGRGQTPRTAGTSHRMGPDGVPRAGSVPTEVSAKGRGRQLQQSAEEWSQGRPSSGHRGDRLGR